jgi:hypothetical protein
LTFKILKNDLVTVLHRSVVRSAADASHRDRRVSFKSDVQESLKLLDTKPSLTIVWKDSHHKHRSRNTNNDVSNINKSKADYTDQYINPKPIMSFSRNNNLLDKMPFCHLTQYCRSNMAVDIARILKVSTSPAGIKYKFSIQVPKEIKNTIDLDKKNENQL